MNNKIIISVLSGLVVITSMFAVQANMALKKEIGKYAIMEVATNNIVEEGKNFLEAYNLLKTKHSMLTTEYNTLLGLADEMVVEMAELEARTKVLESKANAFDSYSNSAQKYGSILIKFENGQLVTYLR